MLGGTDCDVSRATGPRLGCVTGTSVSEAGVPKRNKLAPSGVSIAVRQADNGENMFSCAGPGEENCCIGIDWVGIWRRGRRDSVESGASVCSGGSNAGKVCQGS